MAIEINGEKALEARIDLFTNLTKLEQAITKATLLLEREAAIKCPKSEIRTSIASKVDGLTGTVYTPHRLAPYLEYGTGKESIHPMGGRKEIPWVYVEGQYNEPSRKTIHTEQSADEAVAILKSKGLPAVKTYGSKPIPFMRPALDENRQEIVKILGDSLINE